MKKRWVYNAISVALISCAVVGSIWSRNGARFERDLLPRPPEHAPLYLPKLEYVKLLSLGYDSILARIVWFSTINYFGKQVMRGEDSPWLAHMCQLEVGLDPMPTDPLEFCGVVLPWAQKDPLTAEALLTEGIKHHPDYWRMHYMRGFVRWYFLEKLQEAQDDMIAASKTTDAPAFVQGIASKLMANNHNAGVARQFLGQMLERTKDPSARKSLEEQYNLATLSEHLQLFQEGIRRYKMKTGEDPKKIEDLVAGGILRSLPEEPFGGEYFLDPETGEPKTNSGKKGLQWTGKTAKTGIFAEHFTDLKGVK